MPVRAVGTIVTTPVATAKALPGGVNRAARGLFYKSRKVAHSVSKSVNKELQDEEQPAGKPVAEGPPEESTGEESADSSQSKTEKATAMAEKELQDQIGYTRARRDLAARFGVDPYSTNPVLQQELSRLAQAAWIGGLSFQFTMGAVKALGYVEDISSLVYELSPDELERRNNKTLADIDVPKPIRLALFENEVFTTTLETSLVVALSAMEGAMGREQLVALAAAAESTRDARRIAASASILAAYHDSEQPLVRIEIVTSERFGELVVGATEAGRYVLPAAADYLIWQEGMEGGPLEVLTDKELWLSGRISPRARQELESRGWAIRTEALTQTRRAVAPGA